MFTARYGLGLRTSSSSSSSSSNSNNNNNNNKPLRRKSDACSHRLSKYTDLTHEIPNMLATSRRVIFGFPRAGSCTRSTFSSRLLVDRRTSQAFGTVITPSVRYPHHTKRSVPSTHQAFGTLITGHTAFNTLNAELSPICHLRALLGAHHILHVSRLRVNLENDSQNYVRPHACPPKATFYIFKFL